MFAALSFHFFFYNTTTYLFFYVKKEFQSTNQIFFLFLYRVEVTNKANQTPNHWVYNDMILEDNLIVSNNDLIYPFATSQSTFNSYLGKLHKEKPKYLKIIESWVRFIYTFCREITSQKRDYVFTY